MPASNFSGKSLLPAGASGGITRAGTTDMAGNVKEWCLNAAGAKRYILGGAWTEPVYMFNDPDAQSPFARHATHGFRCIKVDRPEDLSAVADGRHRVVRHATCVRRNRSASRSSRRGAACCTPSTTGT